jgi:hypothetical protein
MTFMNHKEQAKRGPNKTNKVINGKNAPGQKAIVIWGKVGDRQWVSSSFHQSAAPDAIIYPPRMQS